MHTTTAQQQAAKEFALFWKDKGYEKGQSQLFWMSLLTNIFGIQHVELYIQFEEQVKLDHTSYIDGYITDTHVMIEQKSIDKDLRKPIKQSDGSWLSPFQQAQRYSASLPYSHRPRWIVTCNFREFLVYDMEKPNDEPESILLKNLEKEYYRLSFLVDSKNNHLKRELEVSIMAGEIVGELYDELLKQYLNPTSPQSLRSLNILCVRLVFCLYAEDAGIFGKRNLFHDYLAQFPAKDIRTKIIELFKILDTQPTDRDPYLDDCLAEFPYVNGGLFKDETIEIPHFNNKIRDLLLSKASEDFDWSDISPTIFGAVFESTLNPVTRRGGGMHYTSIENIHKVIDPLFLDDLRAELAEAQAQRVQRTRTEQLLALQQKMANLRVLDPACGSGNFLTETYLSLRRIENECLRGIFNTDNQGALLGFEADDLIKVSIHQFYGIEINDFAVTVAKTALWIAEAQMMDETAYIVQAPLHFLPLKSYSGIVEGNALRMDWARLRPEMSLNLFSQNTIDDPTAEPIVYDYIIGNPPFVGNNQLNADQREDVARFFKENKTIDYVACWYFKAAELIKSTETKCALVSTNSICQGEQVPILWKPLFEKNKISIDFAYRTFRWDSESYNKAHVHCVIVGFSSTNASNVETRHATSLQARGEKFIFDGENKIIAKNINGYLLDAPNAFAESKNKPICDVPEIRKGNQPTDGGHLIIEANEYEDFIRREPKSEKFIKKLIGAKEYINGLDRYCLWLVNAEPKELREMPLVMERISNVREARLASPDKGTQRLADTPHLFRETNNPETYIIVPSVSSEKRSYIPLGFLDSNTIPTNLVLIIPSATLYHFGILTSNVHMAWMRAVCGRLKSDYRYSKDIVYNNFVWPEPTDQQREKIERTAQSILDARAAHTTSSLADLYDELSMPPDLRRAHQENDRAVMAAYDFSVKMSENDIVAALFKMYDERT